MNDDDASFAEQDFEQQPPIDVIAYNELRSCADLMRMYKSGKLEIQPDFQREVVWDRVAQSRFIDSLVKQLPIPSMCFSLDNRTQRWKTIDGLQRMSSIISFLGEPDWKLSKLEDIDERLSGKTNVELRDGNDELKSLYERVENLTIPVTVIRCDYEKKAHLNYLFTIFRRLNTGGVRLNNQEVRNCIYSGTFNDMLKRLDKTTNSWTIIKEFLSGSTDRFRSIELILRFYAFYFDNDQYTGNLSKFLNDFMGARRTASETDLFPMEELFVKTADKVATILQRNKSKHSYSFTEALLYGVAKNLEHISTLSEENLYSRFEKLLADESLSKITLQADTSRKAKVFSRLEASDAIFSL